MNKVLIAFASLLGIATAGPAVADDHLWTDGGLYFSGHGLLTNPRASDSSGDRWSYDLGYGVTAAVGYAFVYPEYAGDIRVEFEGSYRSVPFDTLTEADGTFHKLGGDDIFVAGMVNVLTDFHTQTRFTPYVGVGLGWGYEEWQDYRIDGFLVGDLRWYMGFWQAIAGVGFHLSPGLVIDLEYRYFQPNDTQFNGYTNNEGSIGLRMVF